MTAFHHIAVIVVVPFAIMTVVEVLYRIGQELMARSLDRAWEKRQAKLKRAKVQFNG